MQEYWSRAISSSTGSSQPGDLLTRVSCVSWIGRQILYLCATWEALANHYLAFSISSKLTSSEKLSPASWCLAWVLNTFWHREVGFAALRPPELLSEEPRFFSPLNSRHSASMCQVHSRHWNMLGWKRSGEGREKNRMVGKKGKGRKKEEGKIGSDLIFRLWELEMSSKKKTTLNIKRKKKNLLRMGYLF